MTLIQPETYDIGARAISPSIECSECRLAANVTATAFIGTGRQAAFALGDGTVRVREIGDDEGAPVVGSADIDAVRHRGAATAVARFQSGFVSAGHDGRLILCFPSQGGAATLLDFDGRWVDALAVHGAAGLVAAAAERRLIVIDRQGRVQFELNAFPSTVSGLSFSPDGKRIAVSHLDGISILATDGGEREQLLDWKGSHIGVTWSPDGRFLVSATQERELHVWDLVTLQDRRLGGYPHKIHGMTWLAKGSFLVCTGADVITAWSFADAGPAGKPPIEIGYVYDGTVTAVAANPVRTLVAGGYSTGSLLIGGVSTGEAVVARASQGDAITALDWAPDGTQLIAGTASGAAITVSLAPDIALR